MLGCRQCTLDLHGAPVLRSWTTLAHTASAGGGELRLSEPVDWPAGCHVFVSSTAANGTMEEAETVVVREVRDGGTVPRTHQTMT